MLVATCARVNSHRFAFALAAGVFAAFAFPIMFNSVMRRPAGAEPPASVLAIPLVGISVFLIALRVAAGLSADLRAGWMCAATVGRTPQGAVALRRTMWLLGILPMSLVFAAVAWALWNPATALAQTVVAAGLGSILTEALIRGLSGIPCTQPWQPLNANVRAFWPVYLGLILLITQGLPQLILLIAGSAASLAAVMSVFATGALLLRLRKPPVPDEAEE